MRFYLVGDELFATGGERIAFLDHRLLPTRRDAFEEAIRCLSWETDVDLRDRIFEYEDLMDKMTNQYRDLEEQMRSLKEQLEEAKMSDEEKEYLEAIFAQVESDARPLSDWERQFMADQISRYKKYGEHMMLSPKQWAVVKKIGAALDVTPPMDQDGSEL